jgi:hypothetical protein
MASRSPPTLFFTIPVAIPVAAAAVAVAVIVAAVFFFLGGFNVAERGWTGGIQNHAAIARNRAAATTACTNITRRRAGPVGAIEGMRPHPMAPTT